MSDTPTYLVPYDFTPVAKTALRYALNVAKMDDHRVVLLHIVKNDKEIAEAEAKLNAVIAELSEEDQGRVTASAVVGNVVSDIGKMASFTHADLIVMGTHGVKGLKRILGGDAMKVLNKSDKPFLITQDKVRSERIESIVMPFNLAKESIGVLRFAAAIAKRFDAKIHLVAFPEGDEWLAHKVENNLRVCRRYLAENGVQHDVVHLPKENFEKELINYSIQNDADLLAMAYFQESLLPHSFVQHMLDNEYAIPVLAVSAAETMAISGQYSFLGV